LREGKKNDTPEIKGEVKASGNGLGEFAKLPVPLGWAIKWGKGKKASNGPVPP